MKYKNIHNIKLYKLTKQFYTFPAGSKVEIDIKKKWFAITHADGNMTGPVSKALKDSIERVK